MKPDWNPSSPAATPLADAAQVWRVRLDALPPDASGLKSLLADDEIQQAQSFRHPESRARFVVARAALRELLATQLNLKPGAVQFARTDHGKPLLHAAHGSELQFNVSHSGQCVLVALARQFAIGVDVETRHPMPQALELAERYFAPVEAAALRQTPVVDRGTLFFRLWTRKEAMLKAVGTGIANGLANTTTLPGPWTLVEFEAAPDHPAAVAIRAEAAPVSYHDLTAALATHH